MIKHFISIFPLKWWINNRWCVEELFLMKNDIQRNIKPLKRWIITLIAFMIDSVPRKCTLQSTRIKLSMLVLRVCTGYLRVNYPASQFFLLFSLIFILLYDYAFIFTDILNFIVLMCSYMPERILSSTAYPAIDG